MECSICLASKEEKVWAALLCGHVFHEECLDQALTFKNKCPCCRKDCQTYSHGLKTIRLFLDTKNAADDEFVGLTEENAQNVPWLQARILQLQVVLARQSEELENSRRVDLDNKRRLAEMSEEVVDLKSCMETKDARLEAAIKEASSLTSKFERLQKECHNLRVRLDHEKIVSSRLKVAIDPFLVGSDLSRMLADMAAAGSPAPDYFKKLLESRNKALLEANNRAQRAESANVTSQAHAKDVIKKLESEIADLHSRLKDRNVHDKIDSRRDQERSVRLTSQDTQSKNRAMHELPQSSALRKAGIVVGSQKSDLLRIRQQFESGDIAVDGNLFEMDASMMASLQKLPSKSSSQIKSAVAGSKPDISLINSDDEIEVVSWEDSLTADKSSQPISLSGDIGSTMNSAPGLHTLAQAGPSKLSLSAAPGKSFIKRPDLASTGVEKTSSLINRHPDGKGGSITVYQPKALKPSNSLGILGTSRQETHHSSTMPYKRNRSEINLSNPKDSFRIKDFFIPQPKESH